jgi:hypothetical protein
MAGQLARRATACWRRVSYGDEFELTPQEHAGHKIMHVGGLEMEVLKHPIGLPPANQLD